MRAPVRSMSPQRQIHPPLEGENTEDGECEDKDATGEQHGALAAPAPSAPALDAIARCDGPTSTSACWPTVLPSGIVALRGRLTHGPRSPAARRGSDTTSSGSASPCPPCE